MPSTTRAGSLTGDRSTPPIAAGDLSGHGAVSPGRVAAAALSRHNNFDLVRLVAACQVVVHHTAVLLRIPLPAPVHYVLAALPGVPIFFVTSGFLLTGSLERDSNLLRYGSNRALRIYPALWVCFAVTLVLLGTSGFLSRSTVLSLHGAKWIIAQLAVALTNPSQVRHWGSGVPNGSLRTISIELGFYVVLGLLWLVLRRLGRATEGLVLVSIAGASLFLAAVADVHAYATTTSGKLLTESPFPWLWMFFIGVVARRYWSSLGWAVVGRAWLWTPVAIVCYHVIPGAGAPSGAGWLGEFVSKCVLGLMAISWAFTAPRTADRLLRGVDISYGVYLYHFLWINTAIHEGWPRNWGTAALIFVITVGCALVSWFTIELPALRLKSKAPSSWSELLRRGRERNPQFTD